MATQTVSTRAKLLPSDNQLASVNAVSRNISATLEIQWDRTNWIDESDYFISVQGDERMDETITEAIASTADIILSNATERFLPENINSPIQAYLKPHTPIRLDIIIDGKSYRMFTGYIKSISPDRNNGTVNLHCFDNSLYVMNKDCPREAFLNKRADQLIYELASNAGLSDDQINLDYSLHTINAAWFGDRHTWPVMGEVAAAERGRVFFNREGEIRFWSREHIQNQEPVLTVSQENHITSLDFGVAEHKIKNYVTVKATPRASAGIRAVWVNGDVRILDPYTDTLVWIPAGEKQAAFLEVDVPCTNWIRPIANTDYVANTEVSGNGADLTSQIEIVEFNTYGDAAYIEVKNNSSSDVYLIRFQVRANPLEIQSWIKVRARNQESMDNYGTQRIDIENSFIDDEVMAANIAESELKRHQFSTGDISTDIVGVPFLHVGDVVDLELSRDISTSTDQSQTEIDGNQPLGTTDSKYLAQSFFPSFPSMTMVTLAVGRPDNGTFAGDLTVSIQENLSGEPSGSAVASTTVDNGTLTSFADEDELDVALSFTPDISKLYWIVIESSTADNSNHTYLKRYNTSDNYRGKLIKSGDATTWTDISATDLYFKTIGYNGQTVEKMIEAITWSVAADTGFKQTLELANSIDFPTSQSITATGNIFGTTNKTAIASAQIIREGPLTKSRFIAAKARIVEVQEDPSVDASSPAGGAGIIGLTLDPDEEWTDKKRHLL